MKPIFLVALALFVFLSQFLVAPQKLLNRNNDLQEFRSQYEFLKINILENHHLPLWQNRILSGSPLLGDPQALLLYPFNYLSLFLPLDTYFLSHITFHFLLAGSGMYYLARSFKLSPTSSIVAASIYATAPKFIAHLEAGHINMLAAYAWFPLTQAATNHLIKKSSLKIILLLSISFAAIFLNYLTIFIYALLAATFLLAFQIKKIRKETLVGFLSAALIFVLLTGPQLTSALQFFPQTTRNLITTEDLGPTYVSIRRFGKSIISPYLDGIKELSTETVLYVGVVPLIMSGLGFWFLKKRWKLSLITVISVSSFLALGMKTQLFQFLIATFPQLLIFRITTRHWVVVIVTLGLLTGWTLDRLKVSNRIKSFLLFCVLVDSVIFTTAYFQTTDQGLAHPPENPIVKDLTTEAGYFRFYCPTNCIGDLAQYGKGRVDGYNPVMMRNYYDFFQAAAGYKFGSYAVSLPPYQTFVDQPQSDAEKLGLLGVRYVASQYELTDPNFQSIQSSDSLFWYKNLLEKPRVYFVNNPAPVILEKDLPGLLKVATKRHSGQLIFNEIYTPQWQAFDQDNHQLKISVYENTLVGVAVPEDTIAVTVRFGSRLITFLLLVSALTWILGIVVYAIATARTGEPSPPPIFKGNP